MDENSQKDTYSVLNEYKLILNALCTVVQYKGELTARFNYVRRHIACLGISPDFPEELEKAQKEAFEAITEFEDLCIIHLSGEEDDNLALDVWTPCSK